MSRSTSFLLFLVCTVNTATCQVNIKAFIGDDVLLPCVYTEGEPLQSVTVFWRDKDDSRVLNIDQGVSSQSEAFRGRVFSFPELYRKGNFSIVMKNVQPSDSGPYECHVPSADYVWRSSLIVAGERVKVAATTTTPGPKSAAATPSSLHMFMFLLPLASFISSFHCIR